MKKIALFAVLLVLTGCSSDRFAHEMNDIFVPKAHDIGRNAGK